MHTSVFPNDVNKVLEMDDLKHLGILPLNLVKVALISEYVHRFFQYS